MCDHVARHDTACPQKQKETSKHNLVQPVDCRTGLKLQGPTMDEEAASTDLKILVTLS